MRLVASTLVSRVVRHDEPSVSPSGPTLWTHCRTPRSTVVVMEKDTGGVLLGTVERVAFPSLLGSGEAEMVVRDEDGEEVVPVLERV